MPSEADLVEIWRKSRLGRLCACRWSRRVEEWEFPELRVIPSCRMMEGQPRRLAASAAGFALFAMALAALVFSGSTPSHGDALLERAHQAALATASTVAAVNCDAEGCAPAARRTRNECTVFGCTTVTEAPANPPREASRARLQSKFQTSKPREERERRHQGEWRRERARPHEREREREDERLPREQRPARRSSHERGGDPAPEVTSSDDGASEVHQLQAQLHAAHAALKGTTEALQMESRKMKGLLATLGGKNHELREDMRVIGDDRVDREKSAAGMGAAERALHGEEAQHRAEVTAMASARRFVTSAGARVRADDARARNEVLATSILRGGYGLVRLISLVGVFAN